LPSRSASATYEPTIISDAPRCEVRPGDGEWTKLNKAASSSPGCPHASLTQEIAVFDELHRDSVSCEAKASPLLPKEEPQPLWLELNIAYCTDQLQPLAVIKGFPRRSLKATVPPSLEMRASGKRESQRQDGMPQANGDAPKPSSRHHLLNLPPELRERIWREALRSAAPDDPKPAHFHVYDDVYDSCTYDPQSCDRSKTPSIVSLLQTCRAIHNEAVPVLYESQHFQLVVCAGQARPDLITKHDNSEHDSASSNLRRRNCLGKLTGKTVATVFGRIRYATIIIQAGRQPNLDRYSKRIQILSAALGQGVNLRLLDVCFNIHNKARTTKQFGWNKVAEALKPLCETVIAKGRDVYGFRSVGWPPDARAAESLLAELLGMPTERLTLQTHENFEASDLELVSIPRYHECMMRGWRGRQDFKTPKQQRRRLARQNARRQRAIQHPKLSLARDLAECVAMLGVVTAALPLIGVVLGVDYLHKKHVKGEW
jgi:hypothetical protein